MAVLVKKAFFILIVFAITALLSEGIARHFFLSWAPRTGAVSQFWRYDPDLGWSHIPNAKGVFKPFDSASFVSINSKGFRDIERPHERDSSKYRIVVLGDSLVWGYGVDQKEVFTALMEKQREEVEVINLGVSGYGTDQELILLRQEGVRYRPDLIVVLILENDFYTNIRKSVYLTYPKPMVEFDNSGRLVLTNTPVPRQGIWVRVGSTLMHHSYVLNQAARAIFKLSLASGSPTKQDSTRELPFPRDVKERIMVALLLEIHKEAQKIGAELLLILSDGMGNLGREMENYFKARHIRVLNLDPVFPKKEFYKLHLPMRLHWTARGHRKAADRIMNYLEEENLLVPVAKDRGA